MVPENIKEIFRRAHSLSHIPAPFKNGKKRLPPDQAKQWSEAKEAHSFLVDSEPRNDNRLVSQFCVTPQQKKWMDARHLTVEGICQGQFAIGDSPTVHQFMKDWNQKLGVKWFVEEDSMQGMWNQISETFGGLGVESVQFGDGEPVKLGGNVQERFAEKQNSTSLADEVLSLVRKTKEKLGNGIR